MFLSLQKFLTIKSFKMKHLFLILMLVCSISLSAQTYTVTCHSYPTFSESDCFGCGLKTGHFAGLIFQGVKGKTAIHSPFTVKYAGSQVTFTDGFGNTVRASTSRLILKNKNGRTLNQFVEDCLCNATDNQDPAGTAKIFEGLFNQTGASDLDTITYGPLVVGTTYKIVDYATGDDFSNVGASDTTNNLYFIATGTTPADWGDSTSLSLNVGAPNGRILKNDFGKAPYLTYSGVGTYILSCTDCFTVGKTAVEFGSLNTTTSGVVSGITWTASNNDAITIKVAGVDGTAYNNSLLYTKIKVTVYP